jgi:glycosyltransferase involved in cell wall biosynthesis
VTRCAAIIPVRNEETTVGDVAAAAAASPLVDEVLVVDGQSTDRTRERAAAQGARVIEQQAGGKGEAMALGVRSTDAELVVFLDGDLTGFATHHVDRLVRTVEAGGAVMSCGLFDRGPMLNLLFLHVLPILTGQRCMRRELFESLQPDEFQGYRIEAVLNCRAADLGPLAAFVCAGMFHRRKEEKHEVPLEGWLAKVSMLATAFAAYFRFLGQRRLGRSSAGRLLGRAQTHTA